MVRDKDGSKEFKNSSSEKVLLFRLISECAAFRILRIFSLYSDSLSGVGSEPLTPYSFIFTVLY
ncbi:hypothetical protein LEP1GSC148_3142 [Leptospira interrogans serovar Canicola str. LT1962]|nr:hypothetical protein LEP1GSC148_3142 [Leptospira interrogans serovar Canicola str. LT1962]EMN08048.1 hypothetical protein LEP1GSC053_3392 [Leptospira interrogans serovar Muenchen str. Brem 129]